MMAPLMKAKVNSAGAQTATRISDDPRFDDLNAALDAGDSAKAMEAAKKLIAELKSEKTPDTRLLSEARMGLAAAAMTAGNMDEAKQALLAVSAKSLNPADREQYNDLRDLLKGGYRASYRDAFQADMAPDAKPKDRGKAAADQARSLLDLLQKTDPHNSSEIDEAKLRLANALLAGGHYRDAEKAIAGISQKQLEPELSEYLGAIQQEIHGQQIGALTAAFRGDIAHGRYKQAAENATAIVNDLKKYFPEAKGQLAVSRLDQATAQLLNGDIKNARNSIGHITREDLKNASGEVRRRYKDLNGQIEQAAKEKAEKAEIQNRLENIRRLIATPDKTMKNDAVAAAEKLLADVQSRHPDDIQAIERMKLTLAEVGLEAGDAQGAAGLAKEVAAATNDEDTKDQAQILQAQALLQQKPPQNTEAAKMLRSLSETASSPEAQKEARDMLISLESDFAERVGRKAEGEIKAVDQFKKDKFGGGKWEVTFDVPEEKALYQGLRDISAGAKLAVSAMKSNNLTMRDLEGMDENALANLSGVHNKAEAQLLKKTLNMADMALIGIDHLESKNFTWEQGKMYADLSIYKQPGEKLAEWVGEQVRGARSIEEEWKHGDSTALKIYGTLAAGVLDGISAADSFVKDAIKTAREYYTREGGVLGKVGRFATGAADILTSPFTMPATILDYKASDEEREGAIQGTLMMAATGGLLKLGGPALRAELGVLKEGVVKSRLGQYVSKSWVGRWSTAFEESTFAKGVDKVTDKISKTLNKEIRFGRTKATGTGGDVPKAPTSTPTETNAGDTVKMTKAEIDGADADLGSADTLEMPKVEIVEGGNARGLKDVVDQAVGDKSAAQLQASVTEKQMEGLEKRLIGDQYKQLVKEKKLELLRAKADELGRRLTGPEIAELDAQITKQAKAMIKSEYSEGRLRETLQSRMRQKFSKDDVRRMVLGDRIYENDYHGTIERKPGTMAQQEYERLALAKGKVIDDATWESPDGKSVISDNDYWHIRKSNVGGRGDYGLDPRKAYSGEDIRRFYFNLKPDKAGEFANYLTDNLNKAKVNWYYKMPNELSEFQRPDAGVLYVEKGDYKAVKKIVLEYAEKHPEAFAEEIPAFTKQIHAGIAVAEEPLQSVAGQQPLPKNRDGRHSLGSSRSDIIAEAILDAPPTATKDEILNLVRERMKKYGLDPDRPWLARSTNVDDL
jgi:hypothetical protein